MNNGESLLEERRILRAAAEGRLQIGRGYVIAAAPDDPAPAPPDRRTRERLTRMGWITRRPERPIVWISREGRAALALMDGAELRGIYLPGLPDKLKAMEEQASMSQGKD